MKKKRIAFISEHASPLTIIGGVDAGGQNVYVAELARHLVKSNYVVDIFTRWEDPGIPQVINWLPDIRVINVKAGPVKYVRKEELLPYMTEFRENLIGFAKAQAIRYDLVHAHFWMSALVGMELKLLFSIPFIVTFHALGHIRRIHQKEQDRFPPERINIEEQVVKLADHIIAVCPQEEGDLINYYKANPQKISIIPCGFSPAEFYPVNRRTARKILEYDDDNFIILQVCRMVPRKGIENLIRSLKKLKAAPQNVRLVLVGGESDFPDPYKCPEIGRLQDIAKEEGVSDQVIFAGRKDRNKLRFYYSAADIFATTPWYEPFGITSLEAMACGTPVIGSEVGGIKYAVDHGKTGLLVPPEDPDSLAAAIDEMIKDEKMLQAMKKNALNRVHTFFTWQIVAEMVATLYDKVIVTRFTDMLKKRSLPNRNQPVDIFSMATK